MKNKFILRNEDRVMRPVTLADAEFIVKLRNQPDVARGINPTSVNVERQRDWIRAYLARENEFYWIIEDLNGRPIGTEGYYNYSQQRNEIESGRWVMMKDVHINVVASRIQFFDFAFDVIGVDNIYFDIVESNKSVVLFQEICGSRRDPVRYKTADGRPLVRFNQFRDAWQGGVRSKLLRFCRDSGSFRMSECCETSLS